MTRCNLQICVYSVGDRTTMEKFTLLQIKSVKMISYECDIKCDESAVIVEAFCSDTKHAANKLARVFASLDHRHVCLLA